MTLTFLFHNYFLFSSVPSFRSHYLITDTIRRQPGRIQKKSNKIKRPNKIDKKHNDRIETERKSELKHGYYTKTITTTTTIIH